MATRNRLHNVKKIKKLDSKRYFKPLKYPLIPLSVDDLYVTTTAGDRLDLLANQFYQDIRLWWIISIANRDVLRRDSYAVKPGIEIRIPGNINHIVKAFELLNR